MKTVNYYCGKINGQIFKCNSVIIDFYGNKNKMDITNMKALMGKVRIEIRMYACELVSMIISIESLISGSTNEMEKFTGMNKFSGEEYENIQKMVKDTILKSGANEEDVNHFMTYMSVQL